MIISKSISQNDSLKKAFYANKEHLVQ